MCNIITLFTNGFVSTLFGGVSLNPLYAECVGQAHQAKVLSLFFWFHVHAHMKPWDKLLKLNLNITAWNAATKGFFVTALCIIVMLPKCEQLQSTVVVLCKVL